MKGLANLKIKLDAELNDVDIQELVNLANDKKIDISSEHAIALLKNREKCEYFFTLREWREIQNCVN